MRASLRSLPGRPRLRARLPVRARLRVLLGISGEPCRARSLAYLRPGSLTEVPWRSLVLPGVKEYRIEDNEGRGGRCSYWIKGGRKMLSITMRVLEYTLVLRGAFSQ